MLKDIIMNEEKYNYYSDMERIKVNTLLFKQKFLYELLYGNFYKEEKEIAQGISFLDIPLHNRGIYFINILDLESCLEKAKQYDINYNQSFTMYLFDRINKLLNTYSICIYVKEALYVIIQSFPQTETNAQNKNIRFVENIKCELESSIESNIEITASIPVLQINRLRYVFEEMMCERNSNSTKYENVVEKIMEIVQKSYSKRITMEKISSEVFLSAGYATCIFKKKTGQSIMDYVVSTRISKAKDLLKIPGIKIYEVSNLVGYENIPYFSSLFKRRVGMNPKEYQEQHITFHENTKKFDRRNTG